MNRERSIENTKKYAILEVMFFNGYSVGMQSFVLLSLAIYFNMSSFFISIVSSLPTAGYLLQIFTSKVNNILGSRKKTMAIAAGIFGGILEKFINNGVIYIFGEQFCTIRFAFVIGFILRLFSLLELTRVYSFEKTFVYAGGSGSMKSMFSKIMFSRSRYVLNSNKSRDEWNDEKEAENDKE